MSGEPRGVGANPYFVPTLGIESLAIDGKVELRGGHDMGLAPNLHCAPNAGDGWRELECRYTKCIDVDA
jgi:hypothetical protein